MDEDVPVKATAEVNGSNPVQAPSSVSEHASPAKIASIFLKPQPKPKSVMKTAAASSGVEAAPPVASSSSPGPLLENVRPMSKTVVEEEDDEDGEEGEEEDEKIEEGSSKPTRTKKKKEEAHHKVKPLALVSCLNHNMYGRLFLD